MLLIIGIVPLQRLFAEGDWEAIDTAHYVVPVSAGRRQVPRVSVSAASTEPSVHELARKVLRDADRQGRAVINFTRASNELWVGVGILLNRQGMLDVVDAPNPTALRYSWPAALTTMSDDPHEIKEDLRHVAEYLRQNFPDVTVLS